MAVEIWKSLQLEPQFSSLFSDFQLETKPKNKVIEFSWEGAIYWNTWLHMVIWKKDIVMHASIFYTTINHIFHSLSMIWIYELVSLFQSLQL